MLNIRKIPIYWLSPESGVEGLQEALSRAWERTSMYVYCWVRIKPQFPMEKSQQHAGQPEFLEKSSEV